MFTSKNNANCCIWCLKQRTRNICRYARMNYLPWFFPAMWRHLWTSAHSRHMAGENMCIFYVKRNVLDYVKERSPNCYRCCVRQAGFNSIAGRDKVSVSRSLKASIERALLNSYVADILGMYITSHSVLKVLRLVRLSLVNSWRQMVWKEHSWNACNEPM